MADDNTIILKLKLEEAQANAKIKKLTKEIKVVGNFTDEYKIKVAQLNLEEQKLINTRKKLSQATGELIGNGKKGLTGVSKASGGATSATLELGRAISDAPYGIRGVANNLSQFASQFSFMSNKVDDATGKVVGFNGAIKNLGKAIKANAILLVIQAVISAMDYFANKVSKADKALNKLAESTVSESITELTLLKNALEDSSVPLEKKQKLIKGAREEYEDFNDAIKKTPNDIVAAISALDLLTLKYKDFARAKALTELVTEAMKDQAKTLAAYSGDWTDMFDSFDAFALTVSSLASGKGFTGAGQAITEDMKESEEAIKRFEDLLNQKTKSDPSKTYLELIYGSKKKKKDSSTSKISPFKTKDALDIDVKNNLDAVEKLNKQTELINLKTEEKLYVDFAKTEDDKLAYKQMFAEKRLEVELKYELKAINAKEEKEKQSIKDAEAKRIKQLKDDLSKYKKSLKDKGVAETEAGKKSIAKAEQEVDKKIALTKHESKVSVREVEEKYAALFPFWTKMADARRNALGTGDATDDKYTGELEGLSFYLEQYTKLAGAVGDFLQAETDRELAIEENKTNVLNEQLNQRLLNENLSAEERKNIQNKILQNDEDLRKKQNKIKKKAFDTQKALNISIGVANTIAAGIGAANQTYGGSIARIAAMTAVIGAGLAQVAIIARQKFQPEAANTPINAGGGGGAGGGVGDRSFDFNLVGATQGNQVLDAIQGQFNKPVQAYVVSRDMTSQQQLDTNIKNQASF